VSSEQRVGKAAVAAIAAVLVALTVWGVVRSPILVVGAYAALIAMVAVWMTARSVRSRSSEHESIQPALVALPLLAAIGTLGGTRALAAIGAAALLLLWTVSTRRTGMTAMVRTGPAWLVASSVLVVIRPVGLIQVALFLMLGVLAWTAVRSAPSTRGAVASLVDGIGLYAIVNVLGHYAGLVSPAASGRLGGLDSTSGSERVFFPFTASLNLAPAMSAILLACIFILNERSRGRLAFRGAAFAAAAVVIVEADARTAFLSLLAPALCYFAPRAAKALAVPLVVAATTSAIWYPVAVDDLQGTVNSMAQGAGLVRAGESNDVASLNGRVEIWQRSTDYWITSVPVTEKIFGYGARGQARSGANMTYLGIFGSAFSNVSALSTHNSFLQQLFDAGLFGVVALAGLAVWLARTVALRTRAEPGALYWMSAVYAVVIASVTEVLIAPGVAQEGFWVFVVLVLCIARTGDTQQVDASSSAPRTEKGSLRGARAPLAIQAR
jgi:hypothetical protein